MVKDQILQIDYSRICRKGCDTIFKANYHTHAKYCKHGEGEIQEYIDDAIKYGLEELGFTCHIPFSKEFIESDYYKVIKDNATNEKIIPGRESRMDYYDLPNYLNDLKKAKANNNLIKIYSGLECEYDEANKEYVNEIKNNFDYLILGIHHVFKNGILYDFTKKYVVSKDGTRKMDYDDFDVYAENCVNGIRSGLFKYVAHPDFFMDKVEEFTSKCEEVSRRIIECAVENNIPLEINVSDFCKSEKKGRRLMYPRDEFWKNASEYKDLKVIVGTDAHKPSRTCDFREKEVNELVRKYQLNLLKKLKIEEYKI